MRIEHRANFKHLVPTHELDLVFAAQREVIAMGGQLCLYPDLEFGIAVDAAGNSLGLLAYRKDDEGEIWVQIAYVHTWWRRRGIFKIMMNWLVQSYPDNRIGLGTHATNLAMIEAAKSVGMAQEVVYLYLAPRPFPPRPGMKDL